MEHTYDKLSYLQSYLNLLITLQGNGVRVNDEINKVLKAINIALNIDTYSVSKDEPIGLTYAKRVAKDFVHITVPDEPIINTHALPVRMVLRSVLDNCDSLKVYRAFDLKSETLDEVARYVFSLLSVRQLSK